MAANDGVSLLGHTDKCEAGEESIHKVYPRVQKEGSAALGPSPLLHILHQTEVGRRYPA